MRGAFLEDNMSEYADIVTRGRDLLDQYPGMLDITKDWIVEATDELEQLQMQVDSVKGEAVCLKDQINKLLNEVRW
jgi:hypothetical protein